jgi:hypothetical protein
LKNNKWAYIVPFSFLIEKKAKKMPDTFHILQEADSVCGPKNPLFSSDFLEKLMKLRFCPPGGDISFFRFFSEKNLKSGVEHQFQFWDRNLLHQFSMQLQGKLSHLLFEHEVCWDVQLWQERLRCFIASAAPACAA